MLRRLTASLLFLSLCCASAPEAVHEFFHVTVSALQHTHDDGGCCHLHSGEHGHEVRDAAVFAVSSRRQDLPSAAIAGDLPRAPHDAAPAGATASRRAENFFPAVQAASLIPQLLPIPPPVIHKA